ncbi:uncharacterized protein LOC120341236 [Styela clava]
MQMKLVIVLALVAMLAFESGDSWWRRRRRRRRHSCHLNYKAHYHSILNRYRAKAKRYSVIQRHYTQLLTYIHRLGVRALQYGGAVTKIGRELLAHHTTNIKIARRWGDEDELDDEILNDEEIDEDSADNFEDDSDEQEMFDNDSAEAKENEEREEKEKEESKKRE